MAVNKIELKRSAVPGKVPTTSSLDLGEIALNTYDGKAFFKQSGSITTIVELATTSGSITSASFATSASQALTASYVLASGVVGLNLSRIASGSVTASVDPAYGFRVNSNTAITGSLTVSGSTAITGSKNALALRGSGSGVFTVDGTAGRLFQVNDSLSGSLFAVNDISGIPVFEAFSDTTVKIGQFGAEAIIVSGSFAKVTGSLRGTASYAVNALSSSYAYQATNADTASYIPASGVVGLNLSQIISGSLSASISPNYGFKVNTNTSILGSVGVTGSISATGDISGSNARFTGAIVAQTLVVQTVSSSVIYSSGSNVFGNLASNTQQFTGSVLVSGSITVSGSVINSLTASYAISASNADTASQAITASYIQASGVVGLNLSQIASGSATASINPQTGLNVNIKTSISGTLNVSQSINAYNINAGNPTSNQWQSNLNGSYFNNFTTQTDVSEILRFIAGLLSASAPDAAPNTKTYSTYTANAQNTTTGTVTTGTVPSGSSNITINYLTSRGFANSGSTIFSGITPIYTLGNYGYNYTSVAGGTTTVSSSNDAQLFGLGQLSSGNPTTFSVSGSFTFRFKDNSTKIDTATSSSNALVTQTGAGTTSGVTLAKINTSNPAVIPAAYQDGKYATAFLNTIYSGSATAVSQSGYYHISASIQIASGSSGYTVPIASNAEIFFAPLATISTNIPAQTPATGSTTLATLTAVSRSLSGAPYLSGSTYNLSSSFTNLFNPLYFAGAGISTLSTVSTGMTQTSGVTTVSTAGGTIQTANAVFDSTGTVLRNTATIPFETDVVKLNGLYTFGAANITNITQTAFTPTTFTISIAGVNKNSATTTYTTASNYHTSGAFNQPASSGSLAYYTRTQGTDSGTNSGASNSEPFTGESNRILLNDNILSFTGTAWDTTYNLGILSGSDLQVKPGFLVKPGGTYGYWITDPDTTKTNKYYVRRFITDGTTKTSMTLNAGVVFNDWQVTGSNAAGALILFKSSNSSIYTPARFYDPTKTTSNFVTNITANTDGQNPFGSQIALYGNSGGSLASTTYTIPIRNADGMFLNATYTDIYVIIRYKGDPTPLTSITVTFA
jgi:hypothetical protein